MKKAFSLLEILLVIAILAILAAITITAVNPTRQMGSVRDEERKIDLESLSSAVDNYYIVNRTYPASIPEFNGTDVVSECGDTCQICKYNTNCPTGVDLDLLVPSYMPGIPVDPSGGEGDYTGYYIYIDNDEVVIKAPMGELIVDIGIGSVGEVAFNYDWGITGGIADVHDSLQSIETDSLGNVVAIFSVENGNIDRDFGTGEDLSTLTNTYGNTLIAKYDYNGNYLWSGTIEGATANDLVIDQNNDIYLVGEFLGTVDFDPTDGVDNFTAQAISGYSFRDSFLMKLTGEGTYEGTKVWGGKMNDYAKSVDLDNNGNVFIAGVYSGNSVNKVDFDPTEGTDSEACNCGNFFNFSFEFYFMKINSNGGYEWTRRACNSVSGRPSYGITDIKIGPNNDIYIAGNYTGKGDFDTSDGKSNTPRSFYGYNGFVARYNMAGNYKWSNIWGADGSDNDNPIQDSVNSIDIDSDGNLFLTGNFESAITLDGDGGSAAASTNGAKDMFVVKLDSSNVYQWGKTVGGANNEEVFSLHMDESGDIYFTGFFRSSNVDFDPNEGEDIHSPVNAVDAFLTKFNADGGYVWTKSFGGMRVDESHKVTISRFGDIYLGGEFEGDIDLDPSEDTDLRTVMGTSLNRTDAFISKFVPE